MAELVVYAYKINEYKRDLFVKDPLPGWEYELGMGGIVIEFNTFTRSLSIDPKWTTVDCLNCNTGHVYSIENNNNTTADRVIIHENTVYGHAFEDLKQQPNYSKAFNINLDTTQDHLVPMPGPEEDVPELLASTQKKMQSILDQYLEQLRIESKVRIDAFKKEEEKKTQDAIAHIKRENDQLWSKLVTVTNSSGEEKEETIVSTPLPKAPSLPEQQPKEPHTKAHSANNHVRFAEQVDDNQQISSPLPPMKRLSFSLDETTIRGLQHKDLDNKSLKLRMEQQQSGYDNEDDAGDDDEEDMFNLDEEFSDEEKADDNGEDNDDQDSKDDVENKSDTDHEQTRGSSKDLPLSASIKKSISDIDQQFSWIKKKRNTKKYLAQDFDIKSELRRNNSNNHDERDSTISMLATSMPITIHYPSLKNEASEKTSEENDDKSPKKRDILVSSFANYDSSFSDRMLSEQFPPPPRRKSVASSALIRPQLDSLIGKSLDTRGLLKKKANEVEIKENSDDEEFDATLPPHVWAASHEPADV
ncbi:hypothetical protein HMPREF1544_11001 [Mucor circinelloides 1006PhL]|uniref:Uncharacterized protein n=1 Tax=Mucor circinelloides f. circinelloides (strain 1006PhL) TaxID=1220926 RepID=S2JR63_MUCC1|nr:hypothetical protein HMPREF1544_11001 [Mucor circinelloides 1006PhL]